MVADLEVDEITVTRHGLEFPGVPAEALALYQEASDEELEELAAREASGEIVRPAALEGYDIPLEGSRLGYPPQTFSYDDLPAELPLGLSTAFEPRRFAVTASDPEFDLSFVRAVKLTLTRPDAPGDRETLVDYDSDEQPDLDGERTLVLDFVRTGAAIDPWATRGAVFELSLWGDMAALPTAPWKVDASLTFSGEIHFAL